MNKKIELKETESHIDIIQNKKNIIKQPTYKKPFCKLNFSSESKKLLEAIKKNNKLIFTKDLALHILNNANSQLSNILSKLGVDINELKKSLAKSTISDDIESKEYPPFSLKVIKAINITFLEVKLTKEKEVTPLTIILCILRNKLDFTTKTLNKHGITHERLFTKMKKKPTHNTVYKTLLLWSVLIKSCGF